MQLGEPRLEPAGARPEPTWIRIRLRDSLGRPWPGVPYHLWLPYGASRSGETDGDGGIDEREIPLPGVCRLSFPGHDTLRFRVVTLPDDARRPARLAGGAVALSTARTHELRPQWPALHFDAHMHIMSGNCTPLPALYGRLESVNGALAVFGRNHAGRGLLNTFARTGLATLLSEIGELSWRSTLEIGRHTAKLNDALPRVYGMFATTRDLRSAGSGRLGTSIVLPMDIEYCHVDGYCGEPIYVQDGTDAWFYYVRTSGTQPRYERAKVYLDAGEVRGLEHGPRLDPGLRDRLMRWLLVRLSGSSMPSDPPPLAGLPLPLARAAVAAVVEGVLGAALPALLASEGLGEALRRYWKDQLLADLRDGATSELMRVALLMVEDVAPALRVSTLSGLVSLAEYVRDVADDDDAVHRLAVDFALGLGRFALQWAISRLFPAELYEPWNQQKLLTERVALEVPLQMLPMFHYEPRRYLPPDPEPTLDYRRPREEKWDEPFARIVDPAGQPDPDRLYIGMKMYTSLGYRPTDARLPNLAKFFTTCDKRQIPVMTHCTPGGFFSHQRPFFYDWASPEEQQAHAARGYWDDDCEICTKYRAKLAGKSAARRERRADHLLRMSFFQSMYQHPQAWRPLMQRLPNLRICLAHFSSNAAFWTTKRRRKWDPAAPSHHDGIHYDVNWITEITDHCCAYPNFFTDISYLELLKPAFERTFVEVLRQRPYMVNKIMFGTDWYMFLNDRVRYSSWYTKTIAALERVQDAIRGPNFRPGFNLFQQFAVVNPARFYRLDVIGDSLVANYRAAIERAFRGRRERRRQAALLGRLERRAAALRPLQALLAAIEPDLAAMTGPFGVPTLDFVEYPPLRSD